MTDMKNQMFDDTQDYSIWKVKMKVNVLTRQFANKDCTFKGECYNMNIMNGYGRSNLSERLAWKIDLRKAFDTVNWDFLEAMLHSLKFPFKFINWIMMCVRSARYSVLLNGVMENYFEGRRGLCQGDPLSPFLFTIVMEYLFRMLRGLSNKDGYYFHPKCHRIRLSHILFADDLFLFSSGRNSAILALKEAL
ncbi:hypothetical protein QQ045_030297 [Rhodiola kirilowii]